MLGNSIQGFRLIEWCTIFISVILPILTYGCQVWFQDSLQVTLINTLQIVQNEACWKLAGTFHMTPVTILHSLLAILPIHFCLHTLLRSHSQCLASQPPSCLLRNLHLTHKTTLIPSHVPTTPLLPTITDTPPLNPIFSYPNHPATPLWSHPCATFHPQSKNTTPALTVLKRLPHTTIFLSSTAFHTPKLFLHIFAIYNHTRLIIYNYCIASTQMHSLLLAVNSSL